MKIVHKREKEESCLKILYKVPTEKKEYLNARFWRQEVEITLVE